jgi:hypothetical protein
MWTNLTPPEVIQQAYELILRSSTCLVEDILDPRCHSCVVRHDDRPLLAMVNKVGLPQAALPTIFSFFHILMHLGMGAYGWFEIPVHPIWKNPM